MIRLEEYFDVKYGVNLNFSDMERENNGIPFISRTEKNNGVVGYVKKVKNQLTNPANTISVACGGTVLESFLQEKEYYSGRDMYFIKPKLKLNKIEMLFYCLCIKSNAYKYSYGRQANKTLKDLIIPSKNEIPSWVYKTKIQTIEKHPILDKNLSLNTNTWQNFKIKDLFDIEKGREIISETEAGDIPLISSSCENNGVNCFIASGKKLFDANSITVASNGSVGETFYQNQKFYATADVNVLIAKFALNPFIAMFLVTIIGNEKFKFDYGRKLGKERMENVFIKLPVDKKNFPDWQFMENYVKSLNYSKNLM